MSLLNDFARPCVLMEKHREPDGAGGYVTTWTEGAAFSNYQALDTSMQARRAEKEGVTSVYSALVDKAVPIEYGDYFRDTETGTTYRVTGMTKDKALHAWFGQFLPAYPASSVPGDAIFPWLTYDLILGAWDSGEASITVNLWYYTESEATPNAKAQEIADAIGMGGVFVSCDEGAIWLKRGTPWCQAIKDDSEPNVKRRYLNITAEFITPN